jgi:hypothetical protein
MKAFARKLSRNPTAVCPEVMSNMVSHPARGPGMVMLKVKPSL